MIAVRVQNLKLSRDEFVQFFKNGGWRIVPYFGGQAAASTVEKARAPEPKKEKPAKKKREKAPKSDRSPKDRLVTFFEEHNPDNISKIDKLLALYKGKEEDLFKKLKQKYGTPVPV